MKAYSYVTYKNLDDHNYSTINSIVKCKIYVAQ